ncbi:MAG: hypothetical protein NT145_03520 [Elusimicrobia bacterium]|nr:hypothetical protein [Elusimicrobiota bacterium]
MKFIKIKNITLRKIGYWGKKFGLPVYLIGGSVRDILIEKKSLDFDIAVEGNPVRLVRKIADILKAEIKSHSRFKTFVVELPNGHHIDFATTRKEKYPLPGQLPIVKRSNLKEDILRRDFTINALAVSLNHKDFGRVIDFCGGLDDLKKRVLKVLHPLSFRDDPTRILRLAKFASRGFKIEKKTEKLIFKHKAFMSKVSDERISKEIIEIFSERKSSKALKYFKKWNLFNVIFPGVEFSKIINKIDKPKTIEQKLIILTDGMNKFRLKIFLEKFKLSRKIKKSIEKRMKNEAKPILNGNDLIKMGYSPGPLFKSIFEALNKHKSPNRRKACQFVFDNFPQKI